MQYIEYMTYSLNSKITLWKKNNIIKYVSSELQSTIKKNKWENNQRKNNGKR